MGALKRNKVLEKLRGSYARKAIDAGGIDDKERCTRRDQPYGRIAEGSEGVEVQARQTTSLWMAIFRHARLHLPP
jgi:hypothetical protein